MTRYVETTCGRKFTELTEIHGALPSCSAASQSQTFRETGPQSRRNTQHSELWTRQVPTVRIQMHTHLPEEPRSQRQHPSRIKSVKQGACISNQHQPCPPLSETHSQRRPKLWNWNPHPPLCAAAHSQKWAEIIIIPGKLRRRGRTWSGEMRINKILSGASSTGGSVSLWSKANGSNKHHKRTMMFFWAIPREYGVPVAFPSSRFHPEILNWIRAAAPYSIQQHQQQRW